jgi:sec-independent protein translocase protein TatC
MRRIIRFLWFLISAPFRLILWLFRLIFSGIRKIYQTLFMFFTEEEEDSSLPDAFAKTIQNPLSLWTHINELRKHLFRALIYMVIASSISFVFITQIMAFLANPLEGGIESLQAVDVTEPVGTVMRVTLLSGLTFSFPLIVLEIWLFVAPGLKRSERFFTLFSMPFAYVFFLSGMAFAYYLMLPTALPILLNFMGLSTLPRPNSYFPFVVNLLFWMGMSFEFPLVIFILARLGLVTARNLINQWRLAIVIIAVLAAAITTTTDPANMALVMAPMSVLYFISIGLAFLAQKRRNITQAETSS